MPRQNVANCAPLNERLKEELEKKQYDKTAMWKLIIPRDGKCELYDYINLKHDNAEVCSLDMAVWFGV